MNLLKSFGQGGGKIKRKSIVAVLLLLALTLPLSANTVFAESSNVNSGQIDQNNGQNLTNVTNESSNQTARPVYIVSDNINGFAADNARIDEIISGLAKLGIPAYNYGVGPQTHLTVLSDENVPQNALVVEIAGGADAGAIYEKGTTQYKELLGGRKDFIVLTSGAAEINGTDWLPRAHDDNYDPGSFTGIAQPGQFLQDNGINYFEDLSQGNLDQLVQILYQEATS